MFEAFASAAHEGMPVLSRRAEAMGGRVIDADDLDEESVRFSRQLYYMLAMLTADDTR